jgi:hypothetical protein
MPKFNFSKWSKIFKYFIFITLLLLLSFIFLSKENIAFNFHSKNLRKLDAKNVFFVFLRIFNYFFYILFFIAICIAPWSYCCCMNEEHPEPANNEEAKNISFFVNKIMYIINIGYIITSGVNFINDVEYGYSLSIFICSLIYFVISSTTYIIISINCKEMCFPGICQWGYLKKILMAPCCFFLPCKDEEFKKCLDSTECQDHCCKFCCCLCCIGCIGGFLYIPTVIVYYLGLLFYDLFWLIGKFFVFICCCDCWLKEEYDMDSFRFNGTSNTRLDDQDSQEGKEIKKEIKKIKKASNNLFKRFGKAIKKFSKEIEGS